MPAAQEVQKPNVETAAADTTMGGETATADKSAGLAGNPELAKINEQIAATEASIKRYDGKQLTPFHQRRLSRLIETRAKLKKREADLKRGA